ncbi:MAG TPA: hypothetical protein VKM72_04615 [Thermoanaerobaculia bacterium]|nr:hypothetical protein [Thermoanaerobaculia bacterium]
MRFRRIQCALVLAFLLILPAVSSATPLTPFIDLQEKGLTLVGNGTGLRTWGGGPRSLTVNIQGSVRFALLYWAGRQRPDEAPTGTSTCAPVTEPYHDQQMIFDGTPITGTIIGTECQPVSGGGPILNVGYFADVTSIVFPKGTGVKSFTLKDGNTANNLWRLDGATLLVAYTDAASSTWYRVLIWDGLDLAYGPDPTPGDPRVTQAVTLNHGANLTFRQAKLWLVMGDTEPTRPDLVTISNNVNWVNRLDGTDGAEWDTESGDIDIPTGVGTTTVQAFSTPNNQNPDSLLWEVAALRVEQQDHAKPNCPITLNQPGPPARVEVTMKDPSTGLAEIVVTRSENADTVVPPFTVGTLDPVVLGSTKIDATKRSRVEARVTDLAGNVALCDPILTTVNAGPTLDRASFQRHPDVPRDEDTITVTNGKPGLRQMVIVVNGKRFKVERLKAGEERVIDISSAMVKGDNVVTLRGVGRKGGSASVLIWDGEKE